jgi:tetratricopeptide (TPR) repeat protein
MQSQESTLRKIARLFAHGKFGKVISECDKALRHFPREVEFIYYKADACQMLKKGHEAKQLYGQLLAAAPQSAHYNFGYGNACYIEQELEEAKTHLELALSQQPNLPIASGILSHVYLKLNDLPRTLAFIENELAKYKNNPQAGTGKALLLATHAQLLMRQKQHSQARELLRQALAFDKSNPEALFLLHRLNPPASPNSKIFTIAVEGKMKPLESFITCSGVYLAGFEVVAANREEALAYIREIESIAEPASLRITKCSSRKNITYDHCGVTYAAPSLSFDIASTGYENPHRRWWPQKPVPANLQ